MNKVLNHSQIIFLSIVGCFGQGSGGGASSGGETEQTVTNLTVTDVCTSTRTKQDFCNTDTVCESTGIIVSTRTQTFHVGANRISHTAMLW